MNGTLLPPSTSQESDNQFLIGLLHDTTEKPTEISSYEVATLVGVILVVLIVIGFLFALAVFIDCRHQKITALKPNGRRPTRRYPGLHLTRTALPSDETCIVDNMSGPGESEPPSLAVTTASTSRDIV